MQSPSLHSQARTSHARYAEWVAQRNGYTFEILDGGEGCLFRIGRGAASAIFGGGPISSYPLNTSTAATIARDKVFTNQLLTLADVANLGGRCFCLSSEGRAIRGPGYEVDDAREYAEALGYPLFCKPINGSRGDFAELIRDAVALEQYMHRAVQRYRTIVIQPFYSAEEFRVFVFDDEPIFCIEKLPIRVTGDGVRSVRALLDTLNQRLTNLGISPYPPETQLSDSVGNPCAPETILPRGRTAEILGRRNVSVGADVILRTPIPSNLADIARRATRALGLRAAAVDLFCCTDGELRVVELNANPEITSLERLDRWDLIETLWLRLIEDALSR